MLQNDNIDPRRFLDQSLDRGNQNYMWYETGQSIDKICIKEYKHTMDILHSVLFKGYCFYNYSDIPVVKVLLRKNGDIRFVSHDGAHRLGILSALGFQKVVVEVATDRLPVVYEADVDNWVYVKSGLIDRKEALKIFDLYFMLDGTERARQLKCLEPVPDIT